MEFLWDSVVIDERLQHGFFITDAGNRTDDDAVVRRLFRFQIAVIRKSIAENIADRGRVGKNLLHECWRRIKSWILLRNAAQ